MAIQAYILLDDFDTVGDPVLVKGAVVYQCVQATYGLVQLDTQMTGKPHIAVTLDPDGGYPFTVVPAALLATI